MKLTEEDFQELNVNKMSQMHTSICDSHTEEFSIYKTARDKLDSSDTVISLVRYKDIPESLKTPSITRPGEEIDDKYEEIQLTESLDGFVAIYNKEEPKHE
mmetsp:Transcript_247/g.241  ORF Transcript_247/g.241 Transcript_247/m.241 type:complete len:101 (-) Transcript_247:45-347(-)